MNHLLAGPVKLQVRARRLSTGTLRDVYGFEFIKNVNVRTHEIGGALGNLMVDAFYLIALFAIGATIVWAAMFSFLGMVERGSTRIQMMNAKKVIATEASIASHQSKIPLTSSAMR